MRLLDRLLLKKHSDRIGGKREGKNEIFVDVVPSVSSPI